MLSLELIAEVAHHSVVEVLASQMCVSGGRFDLEDVNREILIQKWMLVH